MDILSPWALLLLGLLPALVALVIAFLPVRGETIKWISLATTVVVFLMSLGMVFGFMLGSSVIVEKVFGWPGVGSYAIDALTASDYAPVQGFVLAMGVLFVLLNLFVDVLYGLIDPRVTVAS